MQKKILNRQYYIHLKNEWIFLILIKQWEIKVCKKQIVGQNVSHLKVKRKTTTMQYLIRYYTIRSTTFIFSPSWQIEFDNEQAAKIEAIMKFYCFSITIPFMKQNATFCMQNNTINFIHTIHSILSNTKHLQYLIILLLKWNWTLLPIVMVEGHYILNHDHCLKWFQNIKFGIIEISHKY